MGESGINLSLSLGDSPVIGGNVMVLVDELDNEDASLLEAAETSSFVCKSVSCQTDFDTFGGSSLPVIFCGLFASDCDAVTQCDIPKKVNIGVSTVSCDILNTPPEGKVNYDRDRFKISVPMSRYSPSRPPLQTKSTKLLDNDDTFKMEESLSTLSPKIENKNKENVKKVIVSPHCSINDLKFKKSGKAKTSKIFSKRKGGNYKSSADYTDSYSDEDAEYWDNPVDCPPEKRQKTFQGSSENYDDDDPQLMEVKKCLDNIKMEEPDEIPALVKVTKRARVNLLKSVLQQNIKIEADEEWITDDEVDDDLNELPEQLEQNMKDDEQRTCRECNLTFNSHLLLIEHTESNHVAHICEYCGFTTTFKNKLDRHIVKHTKVKAFICDMCGKQYSQKQNLRDHISRYHNEEDSSARYPYSCEHCKRMYRNESNLIKHLEKDGGNCDTCGKYVPCSGVLFQHKKDHMSCSCEYCEKTFQSRSALQIHINIKHKDKGLQCSKCPKKFLFPSYLKLHYANAHSQSSPQYKCQKCGFCAVTESYLKSHMTRMHSLRNKKRFVCQVCNKNFRSNARLIEHTRIHTGERPFACPVCFKTFYSQSNLYSHERTVHGRLSNYGSKDMAVDQEAPAVMKKVFSSCYQCQSCSATFSNKKKLDAHVDTEHLGIDNDAGNNDGEVSNLNDIESAPMHFDMDSETVVQSGKYDTINNKTDSEPLPASGDDSLTTRSALSLPAYVVPPDVNLVEIDGVQYHVIRSNT